MAKGQLRSNKEPKKPKQNKPKNPPAGSPFAAPPGKASGTGKKR
jgi:hypothetical protein